MLNLFLLDSELAERLHWGTVEGKKNCESCKITVVESKDKKYGAGIVHNIFTLRWTPKKKGGLFVWFGELDKLWKGPFHSLISLFSFPTKHKQLFWSQMLTLSDPPLLQAWQQTCHVDLSYLNQDLSINSKHANPLYENHITDKGTGTAAAKSGLWPALEWVCFR